MSTSAILKIKKDQNIMLSVYKHGDGYPEYFAALIQETTFADQAGALNVKKNMVRKNPMEGFNGFEDYALWLVSTLKGGKAKEYYLTTASDNGADYIYTLSEMGGEVFLHVFHKSSAYQYKGKLSNFDIKACVSALKGE